MKIGIIGSGTMGSGIAQVAATFGHSVIVFDSYAQSIQKAKSSLNKIFDRLVEKGKNTREEADTILGRIKFVSKIEEIADCGLVIEAVIEDIDVKAEIFSRLDQICSPEAILASNTSSLSIASIAAKCKKPERVLGIHFFNPAPLMQLVEIIPAIQTDKKYLDAAKQIIDSWKKSTVIVKDTPGFIVNRVARPFYGEALRIYEEGIADFSTIDWAMKEIGGFRMGPFELMDFIGNDVNYTVTETVFTAFYFDPRYRPAFTQKRYSEAGYLGRKSGRGYYHYSGGENPEPEKNTDLGNIIFERILAMLINEAADALHLNIASREDLDTAMEKGVNYPKGLLKWADEKGIDWCVDKMDVLYDWYGEDRYRCSPKLRELVKNKEEFYN